MSVFVRNENSNQNVFTRNHVPRCIYRVSYKPIVEKVLCEVESSLSLYTKLLLGGRDEAGGAILVESVDREMMEAVYVEGEVDVRMEALVSFVIPFVVGSDHPLAIDVLLPEGNRAAFEGDRILHTQIQVIGDDWTLLQN